MNNLMNNMCYKNTFDEERRAVLFSSNLRNNISRLYLYKIITHLSQFLVSL